MTIRHLLASTSLIVGVTQAYANTEAATDSTERDVAVTQGGIAEIVVTASRRAETVQRAALSIQAISGDELAKARLTRPEDLSSVAVGVSVATGGSYPQTYIRGVGNYATNTYAEGAVAYNLDGVYISRGWGIRGSMFDLERVEVLKGPQGTLYGRNASGGAINLITTKPKLDERSGFAEFEAGNYDLLRASAGVNLPLGDGIALRASGQITTRDGYLSDGYDDERTEAARLHLLIEPSDAFSLLVTGAYQHVGGKGGGAVVNPQLPGSKFRGASDPAVTAIFAAEPGIGGLLTAPAGDGFVDIDVYSLSAEANWDLGPATLTLLPAYRWGKLRDLTYIPGFAVADQERDRQASFEARLANQGDRLKWVLGFYYFDEKQDGFGNDPLLVVRQGVNAQTVPNFRGNIRSYAGFGQATFSLTDSLRLTGGLRYTYERKTQDGLTSSYTFPNGVPPAPCAPGYQFDPATVQAPLFCRIDIPLTGRLSYKSWTYKAGVEFDVASQSMAYANISTGFKSGGFFAAPPVNTFRPEKLTSFEAGIKNRLFDNRLQINIEAFYWRYKDHQEAHLGPTSVPGFFAFITENAGRARSYGADLDLTWLATSADRLTAKVQYNKSKYDSFTYSHPTASFGPPATGCATGPVVNGSQVVDCSGFQLVRAPAWTGTGSYAHRFDLADGASIEASVSGQFTSSSWLSIDFLPNARQGSYATANADLTYTAEGGTWSLSGYVHNITNEAILTQAFRSPFISPGNPLADPGGLVLASVRPPRTYGVRARFNF